MSDDDDPSELWNVHDTLILADQQVQGLLDPSARDRLMEYLGILACWEIDAHPASAEEPILRHLAEYALRVREQEQRIEQEETQWEKGRLRLRRIREYLRKATKPRAASRRRSQGSKPDGTSPT
jgi:hypothetical protein